MKACGIVAEYNPLHTGHVYQMNKARQISQADCIIFARQSALSVSAPKQIEAAFIVLSVRTAPLAKFSALDNA